MGSNFPSGGGVTGDLVRSIDWSATSLGAPATWPFSLKTTLATLLYSPHPMVLWWGPDLVQFYNDAYLPSLGNGKHPAAMGQRGEDCWQEVWPSILPHIDDAMRRGKASWNEDVLVRVVRNGRVEEVYWTHGYSPVFGDDGRIAGTLVVCTETTSRLVAERQLREASVSLATTLDCIGDAVVATDVGGAVVRMNPVAERLTGWSFLEATGKPITEILPIVNEDTRTAVENPIHRALREGVTVRLPARTALLRRDETEIPIGDSCAPIKLADGTVTGAVLVFRDLTAQRTTETLQDRLRTQLIVADRMSSVATLAAGLAHEINNPLTYVMANLETAMEELHDRESSAFIAELEGLLVGAREGVARIAKIVRGVKTFSRIEEERRSVINLVPVIDLAIDMAFNDVRVRPSIVKEYGALPLVHADGARLGQVFINLLVNASQALAQRKQGGEIRVITSTDNEGRAVVEVKDTGAGIPREVLSRIFDPFFTTKPIGVGTGLGLAISHTIVHAMGGEILASSEVDHGTTFRVVLPASAEPPLSSRRAREGNSRSVRTDPADVQRLRETVQGLIK